MKKILIIDDEPFILSMLKKMLEKEGYEVELAENGHEGLMKFEITMPQLVITDIIMPEKEGLGIIREMKNHNPELKIIAISGGGRVSATDYLNTAKIFGADKALQKPFTKEEILGAIKEILA